MGGSRAPWGQLHHLVGTLKCFVVPDPLHHRRERRVDRVRLDNRRDRAVELRSRGIDVVVENHRLTEELVVSVNDPSGEPILTIASTNDAATLDKAAVRAGRFDSIVEVAYPRREAAARILAALVDGLPGGDAVNTGGVAVRLPENTSGSDLREIVRRAVLSGDGSVFAEIGSGRYLAAVPGGGGQYL